jgi:L-asparaginase
MTQSEYPSVLLIYTGGTIGMIENPETGALEAFNFDQLQDNVPELKRFNYRISSYQFNPPIDSSDMEPALWAKLVKIIKYNYDNFDGFVILHGTDTMAYTASALSFMLENLSKPVVMRAFAITFFSILPAPDMAVPANPSTGISCKPIGERRLSY